MTDTQVLAEIRRAVADYMQSEGCSCCQDAPRHTEAAGRLARLLNVPAYPDASGFDFSPYCTSEFHDE